MSRRRFSNVASLIDYLLDRYEKNPDASRWIAAIDQDSLTVNASDTFEEDLALLEKAGGVEVLWTGPKWERSIKSVKLRNPEVLYRHIERQPAPEFAAASLATLRAQQDFPVNAVLLIDEAALAWSRKCSYMGIMPGESRILGQVLRLAGAVSERLKEGSANEIDFRTFSRLVSGDSKALERNLSPVVSAISRFSPLSEIQAALDAEELLASVGIKRLPQPVLISGTISLDDQPFQKMPFVGVPAECAGRLNLHETPDYLLTIENFSSFVRYVREIGQSENGLIIYSGGFPSRPVLDTIVNMARQAGAPAYHWGDMDGGGVRIFRYIEQHLESIGVSLQPHMMNVDLLRQVGSKAQAANRFVSDMAESAIAELASFIEQVGLVHEQEEFDPKSPLATSRQVRP
ncbi:Wadjet anti-phage system protein JetD domain-containing protein [Agrobacterium leguminum]|uniref:Wadjet anti-phage system protein JetD domain-containing protein n=1 Tax=Agrobacterium leguminum TaxID=2792015 RepID=UPI003CE4EF11